MSRRLNDIDMDELCCSLLEKKLVYLIKSIQAEEGWIANAYCGSHNANGDSMDGWISDNPEQ